MSDVKSVVVKLFDCIIARRGKAAKGTVKVQTFGKPLPNKPNRKGIIARYTRFWSYDHAESIQTEALMAECAKIAPINLILMRGADAILKSSQIRSQSHVAILSARIMADGLAIDSNDAKTLAQSWLSQQAFERKNDSPVTTIESFIARRVKAVAKLKAQGLWIVKPVASSSNLVKPEKPVDTSEPVSDEDEDDTDEEEEEDSDDEDAEEPEEDEASEEEDEASK